MENKHNHELFVMKTINNSIQNHRFLETVRNLSKIKNPALLPIIDFYPIIATKYMEMGSIKEHIKNMDNTNKFINLIGIALGIQYLHSLKIKLLNLKPENIILDDDLYPHISDFGLSEFDSNEILRKSSFIFSAPEVLNEEVSSIDFKSDVYSYSLIAYYIITGEIPMLENSLFLTIENIKNGKRPDLSIIKNEKIQFLLESCWSAKPKDRPSFEYIIEHLCDKEFYSTFQIESPRVFNYLYQFINDSNETQQSFIKNIYDKMKIPKIDLKPFEITNDIPDLKPEFKIVIFGNYESVESIVSQYDKISEFYHVNAHTKYGDVNIKLFNTMEYELEGNLRNMDALVYVTDVGIYKEYERLKEYLNIINEERIKRNFDIFLVAYQKNIKTANKIKDIESFANKNEFVILEASNFDMNSIFTTISLYLLIYSPICKKSNSYTIILLGSRSPGKSSLLKSYKNKKTCKIEFQTFPIDLEVIRVSTKNGDALIRIYDTNGLETCLGSNKLYASMADAAIFVIDAKETQISCFQEGSYDLNHSLLNMVLDKKNCLLYLDLNKIDLGFTNKVEELQEFADKYKMKIFQTSIYDLDSVNLMFDSVIKDITTKFPYIPQDNEDDQSNAKNDTSKDSCLIF